VIVRTTIEYEHVCKNKTKSQSLRAASIEPAGLMDKAGVWSSLPACSWVDKMMVGSGMVVKNETTQTQAARPFVWQSQFSSAWG
jgi:hypothetical protein